MDVDHGKQIRARCIKGHGVDQHVDHVGGFIADDVCADELFRLFLEDEFDKTLGRA